MIESAKLCGVNPTLYLSKAAALAIEQPGKALLRHELV